MSKKRKRRKKRPEDQPQRRTSQTFGICALFLAVFSLCSVLLTQSEDALSPWEISDALEASGPTSQEREFDPGARPDFTVTPLFAACSLAMIAFCVIVIGWLKGEWFWIGWVAIAVSLVAIAPGHWIVISVTMLLVGIAWEIALRTAIRPRMAPRRFA
ncbi:hypothetical protein JXA47_06155 [Candidatus Sumerlaeota bacterium]|nr:hypothetical protein [Candidatus Sumerlaeota bacterium]